MNPFENINYDGLAFLIKQLDNYSDEEIISKKFASNFPNYTDNINFLESLNLIDIKQHKISTCKKIDESNLKIEIIKSLLDTKNIYTDYFKVYISFYKEDRNGDYIFQEGDTNLSDIRIFLLSIGLIDYADERVYRINDVYKYFIFSSYRKYSPEDLERDNIKNKEKGDAAELVIMEYEISRLKKAFNEYYVNHVALKDTKLGYDILSGITKSSNDDTRFIEVKAVSDKNYTFYWSSGEIEASSKIKNQYYLYLLPSINNEPPFEFDINMLRIIKDPYKQVYESDEWNREAVKYRFSSKK